MTNKFQIINSKIKSGNRIHFLNLVFVFYLLFGFCLLGFYNPGHKFTRQKIVVNEINKDKFEQLIKNRNGKILLVNLWATWCIPCRDEFPDLVKLHNNNKNVEVVGISIDYKDEVNTKIIPFLKEQKAHFKNFVNGFIPDTELIDFIDKNWNGALPATIIFDKNGKKIKFIEGKQSYNSLVKIISESK